MLGQFLTGLLRRIWAKGQRMIHHWAHEWVVAQNQGLQAEIEASRQQRQQVAYCDRPRLTLIVQFFNKRQNIPQLMANLRLTSAEELIVIDDGSSDGSYLDWPQYLSRPNDFLLRCNDLFEVRTYDRAMRMARGEIVCLLQDDDWPPPNNQWVEDALRLFEHLPQLLILGGRDGIDPLLPDLNQPIDPQTTYERQGAIVEWKGVHKLKLHWQPAWVEPQTGIPFQFTIAVNRAPTFLRRREFLELGGINQNYAPFQLDDDDACIRAWLAGYQVGFYAAQFIRGFDVGGMTLFNQARQKQLIIQHAQQLYQDYGAVIADGSLQATVDRANATLVKYSGQMPIPSR